MRFYAFEEYNKKKFSRIVVSDFCVNVLMAKNRIKAANWYETLSGWYYTKLKNILCPPYYVAKMPDDREVAVIMQSVPCKSRLAWLPYIWVKNVETMLPKVKELGGKIIDGPTLMPSNVRYLVIRDTVGAYIGLLSSI